MGRQVAHSLSALGGHVYCVDIVGERAEDVAKEIGGQAHVADVRLGEQVRSVVEGAAATFGRVHGVVDVIGMARWAGLAEMPEEDWDWVHAEVVRHAFHFVKFGGRAIAEGGGGSIVFVASVDGLSSAPYHAAYGAANAGLISLVRTAAVELKAAQVRVNVVAPGGVATPRFLHSQGISDPELVASGSLSGMARTSEIARARCPSRSSCSLRRILSKWRAPIPCPRPSSIASSSS